MSQILIVEDSPYSAMAKSIQRELSSFTILEAKSIEQAEEMFNDNIVLIICDMALPRTKTNYREIANYSKQKVDLRRSLRNLSRDSIDYDVIHERIITLDDNIAELTNRTGGLELINNLLVVFRNKHQNQLLKLPVPILFLTGYSNIKQNIGLDPGFKYTVLEKPIEPMRIIGKINDVLVNH